jgi:hypothetical protein
MKSLKLKWIKKILDNEYYSPWKSYLNTKFKSDINDVPFHNLAERNYPVFKDQFYNDLFTMWAQIHFCNPKNIEEICQQTLWHNTNIQKENKCIIYKDWEDNHINYIQDLIQSDGNLLTKKEIEKKYDIKCKQLDYESLIHAIPSAWKQEIKRTTNLNMKEQGYKQCKVKSGDNRVNVEEINTKRLY